MRIRLTAKIGWPLLGALAGTLVLVSSAGAANQGDPLRLGLSNTINLTTTLTGSTAGPQLAVSNTKTGTYPAIRGQSSSAAANTFSIYGLLTALSPLGTSAALRGENKATNGKGYGVWGSHAGGGTGVYGSSVSGRGIWGQSGIGQAVFGHSNSQVGVVGDSNGFDGVWGASHAIGSAGVSGHNDAAGGYGVWGATANAGFGVYGASGPGDGVGGKSTSGVGVRAMSESGTGLAASSGSGKAINASSTSSNLPAIFARNDSAATYGIQGQSVHGVGIRGESDDFQGVSGYSAKNAGVFGQGHFAGYFVGPTEQHGALNVYDSTSSVANGNVRIARGTASFSGTGAALQAEHAGTNGEAAWFRIGNAANTNAVLMLVRPTNTGDFMRCYQQGMNEGQKCHIDANGTFQSGSHFAEALPARGGKARYEPGDVLSMNVAHPGQVIRSQHPRDRALIGVYSTRPAVLGADKGGLTRVGKNDVPVAITGIVPVKVTAQSDAIRPGDLLTSSTIPGRAMNAGRNPAIGTVLGKALGSLRSGRGTIKMLVMLR